MENRPYKTVDTMLFNDEGRWYHSKLNKTGFAALCKVEALDCLEEMWNGTINNHCQLHSIIIDNYEPIIKEQYNKKAYPIWHYHRHYDYKRIPELFDEYPEIQYISVFDLRITDKIYLN